MKKLEIISKVPRNYQEKDPDQPSNERLTGHSGEAVGNLQVHTRW